MNVEEILAALIKLSDEEKQLIVEQCQTSTDTAAAVPADDGQGTVNGNSEATEPEPSVVAVSSEATEAEPSVASDDDAESNTANDEDIPIMSKDAAIMEDVPQDASVLPTTETDTPVLLDEQGGEIPVDHQSIIDGLNAKVLALEVENKQLKAKTDGAFGLMGKPSSFGAVNPLYGDTSDIPQMRK